jgi:RNA-directed DNA polymerase
MSLKMPDKIRSLQRKLYCKAKAEPAFRFYVLYDKIYREDVLSHAYRLARANAGAPGVDGMTFAKIEDEGLEAWLAGLREQLVLKTYRPDPVRRVMIPKASGDGERPLGIPTIRDRVVQAAAKIVLEPIFEADLEESAYGYRPKRGAVDAVREVHRPLCQGYTDIVDADDAGVDEGGDDEARADNQRGEDLAERRPQRALRFPGLLVWTPSL